jgi:cell division protein ZapE
VQSLDELIRSIPAVPAGPELLASFVPPPRFTAKRFADYRPDARHPTQAAARERLEALAATLEREAHPGLGGRVRRWLARPSGGGVYLDGGFGVGKTHLMASLWNAAPAPKSYLAFDELVYTIGLLGVAGTREVFRAQRLVCVDEWELDDPGNLKLALAFLRGALEDGVRVVVTSNTVPDELGRGRFSQKDFATEIAELASAFEVLRVEGEDFRHRRFRADPGRESFLSPSELERWAGPDALRVGWSELLEALGRIHPIRYSALAEAIGRLAVEGIAPLHNLAEGLRWVHFVDKLYDGRVPLAASAEASLGEMVPEAFLRGPYGKKFSRCLSRLEELLGERVGEGKYSVPSTQFSVPTEN